MENPICSFCKKVLTLYAFRFDTINYEQACFHCLTKIMSKVIKKFHNHKSFQAIIEEFRNGK